MTVASDSVQAGQLIGGKYKLRRHLADGGMGSVWVAHHEVLDVEVALKLMSPDVVGRKLALQRFEREAKASAKLRSNHIVRVHDYGVDGDMPFMVMELLEGEDLGQRLKRDGPMSVEELAPLLTQICKGLEVACEAGIVHRDLKPSNVFIARESGDEVVKLVDFGVARETKSNIVDGKTKSGVVVGSPHHMSPEQASGLEVDHRSDLWSLGVLVFRALTGVKPFQGDVMTSVLLQVVSKPIPSAVELRPQLPATVDRFLAHALTRNVDCRFQRAQAMAEAFAAVAAGETDLTPYLTEAVGEGEGRDEPTIPSIDRVDPVTADKKTERSDSREVGAVTAGVIAAAGLSRRRSRLWLWLPLGALLLVAAFLLGRSDSTSTPEPGASAQAASQPSAAPELAASAPAPAETAAATASATAEASTVAPPPPVVRPAPRPAPQPAARPLPQPARPRPPPKPRIDPFTGLPAK